MRYQEILNEVAPYEEIKGKTFYHGTSSDDHGKAIMKEGLKPGNIDVKRGGLMMPVMGRTYFTENLQYGIIYCIGGNMLGCSEDSLKYLIDTKGRDGKPKGQYGWLFAISGENILNDIQPDEDSIGEAIMITDRLIKGKELYDMNPFAMKIKSSRNTMVGRFHQFAKYKLGPTRFKKCCEGEYAHWAAAGKTLMRHMPDDMKRWLINCGAHVAHEGPIMPDQAWRFDKMNTPKLKKDGSDFFEFAVPMPM